MEEFSLIYKRYGIIPKELLEKGYDLDVLGISEIAWKRKEIFLIIQLLQENKIPVLGGDVYSIKGGKIMLTYDSWFTNNDNGFDFISKSLDNAILYIANYENRNGNDFIYSLVF